MRKCFPKGLLSRRNTIRGALPKTKHVPKNSKVKKHISTKMIKTKTATFHFDEENIQS